MFTVIIYNAIIIAAGIVMATCAAIGLYVMSCDEVTRESMGVRI
jgi:hypothetical protein